MITETEEHTTENAEQVRLLAEVAALESRLADRELFLANLRAEVAAFEGRYLREVGALYAELDEWLARMAELTAEMIGSEESKTVAAEARAQAEETFAASHGEAARIEEFHPQPELKKLFHLVVRQVHPDRASDERDRAIRENLMSEANLAYKRQDADGLRRILESYQRHPAFVEGAGNQAKAERLQRQVEQIRRRLMEIEKEIVELNSSETGRMMQRVRAAMAEGRDLLDEMARGLKLRIESLREAHQGRAAGWRTQ